MSAPQQPAPDTTATAEATSGAVLSPPVASSARSAEAALPDPNPDSDDALLDDAVLEEGPEARGASGSADDLLVREGDVAGDYLERLLDILDVDGDIDLDVEGDRASVAVVGGQLDDLVGDGSVLDALQELTRLAVSQATGVRSRLMLDIGGFRAQRRSELSTLAAEAARRVAQSRQPERLSPMNPFERKVVHDMVAAVDGVHSESEGEEPRRRVVILPGS